MSETTIHLLKTALGYLIEYSVRLVIAGLILFIGFKISAILVKKYPSFKGKNQLSPEMASFVKSVIGIVSKLLVIVTAIAVVGIPMASVITVLASAGVAIGLAIQGSLSNVASGVIIVLLKPFRVGDFIIVDSNSGTVSDIDLFYTRLVTADNREILIPNSQLTNNSIINVTAFDYRRVEILLSAGYECDSENVKRVILETASATPDVILEPVDVAVPPFVAMSEQADSSVIYTLRVWCRKENFGSVTYALNESMKKAFEVNNISVPYPQIDVHLGK